MKKLKTTSLLFLITLLTFFSCEDEQILSQGHLKVTFANQPANLVVFIFPTDNPEKAIFHNLKPERGILDLDLNTGNYFIECSSSSVDYYNPGFQIMAGRTTTINFDFNNIGIPVYN